MGRKLEVPAIESRTLPSGLLDGDRLAVLADILEDSGCRSEELLAHLREPGVVHVAGCWAVEAVTCIDASDEYFITWRNLHQPTPPY